jgi:hypothetical protein
MDATSALLTIAKAYSAATGQSLRSIGFASVQNYSFFTAMEGEDGSTCTVRKAEQAMAWLDANWPDDLARPVEMTRGLPLLRDDAA